MADPVFETLILEVEPPLGTISLNQPQIFNPLDTRSGPELAAALENLALDDRVRAVILTGRGKAFSAGGNVRAMAEAIEADPDQGPPEMFMNITRWLNATVLAIRRLDKPVVCAMNGVASGGGLAWAMACDLVVAARSARLDSAYIRIGFSPDGGLAAFLPLLMGHKRATEFLMLGGSISAEEGLAWGLVNRVVDDGAVLDEAQKLALDLAARPRLALARTKALLHRAFYPDLERIVEDERRHIVELSARADFREGIASFFEKRPPRFRD
ncbi:MAG: enoyl-CoA hydratase/isomerase family protein [Proteobacteria bacterium]|nr:enoyl-CoA hydratase/isomerase family protein [Pseudomonadota bacterium]MBU1740313.1 enoyl-CoA hydratase/isomerase family protein [Pseudomonadota bacterium]